MGLRSNGNYTEILLIYFIKVNYIVILKLCFKRQHEEAHNGPQQLMNAQC
jgi:hypothetical protein